MSMATITLSMPKRYVTAKKEFPEVNWNEVMKASIIKRLHEVKKFEDLKRRGEL